ncbi:predicted protein [Brucella abortus bv. 6 str. 870]|nr:predicted protein [Brucella abortus bv. 6 str. 870]
MKAGVAIMQHRIFAIFSTYYLHTMGHFVPQLPSICHPCQRGMGGLLPMLPAR